jgi:hypothetical protein
MTEPILQFFEFSHLPVYLQPISRPFHELAHLIVGAVPRNPERTVALRKLLEAKDAAVRAAIYAEPIQPKPTDDNGLLSHGGVGGSRKDEPEPKRAEAQEGVTELELAWRSGKIS